MWLDSGHYVLDASTQKLGQAFDSYRNWTRGQISKLGY